MLKARSRATKFSQLAALTLACVAVGLAAPRAALADGGHEKGKDHEHLGIQWVNHFDLLSGDPTVTTTSSLSTSSGVGGDLTALVITSGTTGDTDSLNGNKVVQMALELPQKTAFWACGCVTNCRIRVRAGASSTKYASRKFRIRRPLRWCFSMTVRRRTPPGRPA